jgi:hypothetical protein
MRRIQNQTSTSQLAALLLLIPPNSGRPDFCLPIYTEKSGRITELGGLVWLDRMTGFFRTWHAGIRYAKEACYKSKTLASELAEVLFLARQFQCTGILRDNLQIPPTGCATTA